VRETGKKAANGLKSRSRKKNLKREGSSRGGLCGEEPHSSWKKTEKKPDIKSSQGKGTRETDSLVWTAHRAKRKILKHIERKGDSAGQTKPT